MPNYLKESIAIITPLYLNVIKAKEKIRATQPPQLKSRMPVSFRKLTSKDIEKLIESRQTSYSATINPTDGIADTVKK